MLVDIWMIKELVTVVTSLAAEEKKERMGEKERKKGRWNYVHTYIHTTENKEKKEKPREENNNSWDTSKNEEICLGYMYTDIYVSICISTVPTFLRFIWQPFVSSSLYIDSYLLHSLQTLYVSFFVLKQTVVPSSSSSSSLP